MQHQQKPGWSKRFVLHVHLGRKFDDELRNSVKGKKFLWVKLPLGSFEVQLTASPCPKSWARAWFICGSVSWCATAAATSSTARWTAASSTVGKDVGEVLLRKKVQVVRNGNFGRLMENFDTTNFLMKKSRLWLQRNEKCPCDKTSW